MKTKAEVTALLQKVSEVEALLQDSQTKASETERTKAASVSGGSSTEPRHNYPIVGADSDEKKAMRYFGCGSVKELVKINTADPKFAMVPDACKYVVRELKKSLDYSRAISQMFYERQYDSVGEKEETDRIISVKSVLTHAYGRDVLAPRMKAFGSTVSGGGDEWVPTIISSNYIQEYVLEHVLESRFKSIPMRSNPFQLPVQSGVAKARKVAENTAATDTSFTTSVLTFTATKIFEYYILPEELTEDSAVDFLPVARDAVIMAQIKAVESADINGDDDGTHIDSDTQAAAANVAEKFWKGLRRQALANSVNGGTTDFGGAAITKTNLSAMRANMGKFGTLPTELLWVVGPAVYQQFLSLSDVSTVDKFGPQATVLRGALAAYQGIPIVISEHMREDLNDSGVYDGTTTTKGGVLLVNQSRWYQGQRRPIIIKAMPDLANQDRFLLASYQRKDFQGMPQSATEVSVSYGIDVLV